MKTDSEINIKGIFLDKDIKQESLAEVLIESMEDAGKIVGKYKNLVDRVIKLIIDAELHSHIDLAISYYLKYLSSTWLTRWYWKGKYKKTCKQSMYLLHLMDYNSHYYCQ